MNTAFDSVSDLEKQVRQIYEQAQLSQRYNQLRLGRSSLEFRQAKAEVEREVLKPWAERWNLTDPWCIDWVGTLKINSWYGDDRTDLWGSAPWAPGEVHTLQLPDIPSKIRLPLPWHKTEETWDAYAAKARRRLEIWLAAYRARIELQAESCLSVDQKTGELLPHYVRAPEIRQENYFDHLVAYQVRGLSFKAISRMAGVDCHAIRRGITLLARQINLTLRPTKTSV